MSDSALPSKFFSEELSAFQVIPQFCFSSSGVVSEILSAGFLERRVEYPFAFHYYSPPPSRRDFGSVIFR
jgi:hypothetical protein